ncbi:DUF4145 domain-containing protein [Octadecabacter sp.]|nr:DUF4145 domain-containing protein [Octadecabacter sp.]
MGLRGIAVGCSNEGCKKVQVTTEIITAKRGQKGFYIYEPKTTFSKKIVPDSLAKIQPEYIPSVLREDYTEACLIRNLSPKASATLARRCIQGMIRDLCDISKGRLVDEIKELKRRIEADDAPKGVSDDSVEAIDHVRKIGNIGAHMEKDIGVIVSVEPDEAQLLIELIESLFDEWYVARNARTARFSKLKSVAVSKEVQKTKTGG